jgi:hypothetical protein
MSASLIMVCPACQATWPAEAGLTDAHARAALKAALALWPAEVQPHLLRYLGLFRPAQRALRWDALARRIEDLAALVGAGVVTRHRDSRPAPLAAWGAGLGEVLALAEAGRLTLPLTGHGLLAEIVHRQAGQTQAQHAAAHRPLHPSHRPAAVGDPATAPAAAGGGQGLGGGLAHITAIARTLGGRTPPETP